MRITRSVALRVIVLICAVAGLTVWGWDYLIENPGSSAIVRDIAVATTVLFTGLFSVWKLFFVEQTHFHARLQKASEMLAQSGEENSYVRISALQAFHRLVRDSGETSRDVFDIAITFLFSADVTSHDIGEFVLAKLVAEHALEVIDEDLVEIEKGERKQRRATLGQAVGRVNERLSAAGKPPID